jgi:hypothetical protein
MPSSSGLMPLLPLAVATRPDGAVGAVVSGTPLAALKRHLCMIPAPAAFNVALAL